MLLYDVFYYSTTGKLLSQMDCNIPNPLPVVGNYVVAKNVNWDGHYLRWNPDGKEINQLPWIN